MSIVIKYSIEELHKLTKSIPSDHIFLIDNFVSDELCDIITKEIDNKAKIDESEFIYDTNVKCKHLPVDQVLHLPFHSLIVKQFGKFGILMNKKYAINSINTEPLGYRKIYGNTRIHVDGVPSKVTSLTAQRTLSIIVCLNDDYEGGELVFPIQNRELKLKKGQAVAFPPYWTHPHYTNDLKNNTFRYTINSWFYE